MLNIITGINWSKTLAKHVSCESKCKFDGRKFNSDQWWNNDKCCCESKKHSVCEKGYVWNPSACYCENRKYLAILWIIQWLFAIKSYTQKKQILMKKI